MTKKQKAPVRVPARAEAHLDTTTQNCNHISIQCQAEKPTQKAIFSEITAINKQVLRRDTINTLKILLSIIAGGIVLVLIVEVLR